MNTINRIGKKSIDKLLTAVLITAVISCSLAGCSGHSALSGTKTPEADVYNNQYVIYWDEEVSEETRHSVLSGLTDFSIVSEFGHFSVVRNDVLPQETILDILKALPGVEAADPDYIFSIESADVSRGSCDSISVLSSETGFFSGSQWALDNPGAYKFYFDADSLDPILLPTREDIDINFTEASELFSELVPNPREITIAIIDTGIDISHPDLRDSIWTNPLEIPDDGIDNDGNGYIDDIYGWDFFNSDNTLFHPEKGADGNYADNDTHGTQVAGIIAASGNVSGLKGAASFAPIKIMSLKINGGPKGSGSVSSAIKAINYATEKGARVCNMSWGSSNVPSNLSTLEAAMKTSDMLFVTAAGNTGTDNDIYPVYPANIRIPNNISVTFVNEVGRLVAQTLLEDGKTLYGSNYGKNTVDIAAPGTYIFTTSPDGKYSSPSGSSMAAPFVSALAAVLMSTQDNLYPAEIRNLIISSCKTVPSDMITPTVTPTPSAEDITGIPNPTLTPGAPSGTPGAVTPSVTQNPGIPSATPNPDNPSATPNPGIPSATPNPGTPSVTPGFGTPSVTPATPSVTPGSGTPSVTPGSPSGTPGTGAPAPTQTPVPTPPVPTHTPGPSESPATPTPTAPPGQFIEAPEVTHVPGESTPTPEPTVPANPFELLTEKILVPGIPDMFAALADSPSLSQDTDIPTITITRTFDKSMILLDALGIDGTSGARIIRYIKESNDSTHSVAFFRRGIGGTAFTGPLKLARPGIYSFYVADYAGNESVIRYILSDDTSAPEITLLTTLRSPSGVTMAVLDVSDFESGLSNFLVLSGDHVIADFTAPDSKDVKLHPVNDRLMLRFSDADCVTLYATDYRGNATLFRIEVK